MDKAETNQHFLPQSYLREFLPLNQGTLPGYDKQHNVYKRPGWSPRNICASIGMYDLPVGPSGVARAVFDDINGLLEGAFLSTRRELKSAIDVSQAQASDQVSLTPELERRLSLLIAHQFLRTPSGKRLVITENTMGVFLLLKRLRLLHRTVAHCFGALMPGAEEAILSFKGRYDFDDATWTDAHAETLLQLKAIASRDMVNSMADKLCGAKWFILSSTLDKPFISSDRPVLPVRLSKESCFWGVPDSIILWPISSLFSLVAFTGTGGKNATVRRLSQASPSLVEYLNHLQFLHAERYVFGAKEESIKRAVEGADTWTPELSNEFLEKDERRVA